MPQVAHYSQKTVLLTWERYEESVFSPNLKTFFLWSSRLQSQLQALHTEGEPPTGDSFQNASVTC